MLNWALLFLILALIAGLLGFGLVAELSFTAAKILFFVFLFIVWRVFFRLYEGFPSPVGNTPFERKAAYIVHRLLIFLLLLQVFTGPLYLFTEGEGVNVFGWFTVSIPLEGLSFIHEAMEVMHIATGLVIIPLVLVLHISGAIRHYWKQDTPSDL